MNIQTFARASQVKALIDSLSNDLSRISGNNSDGTPIDVSIIVSAVGRGAAVMLGTALDEDGMNAVHSLIVSLMTEKIDSLTREFESL